MPAIGAPPMKKTDRSGILKYIEGRLKQKKLLSIAYSKTLPIEADKCDKIAKKTRSKGKMKGFLEERQKTQDNGGKTKKAAKKCKKRAKGKQKKEKQPKIRLPMRKNEKGGFNASSKEPRAFVSLALNSEGACLQISNR
jgi:hypothetical protein